MKQVIQNCPFYLYKVPNHIELKKKILKAIADAGIFSIGLPDQKIFNTDWHLPPNHNRPYFEHIHPVIQKHNAELIKTTGVPADSGLDLKNYWFQQYKEGDCHGWHIHGGAVFSNVYYVDLPNEAVKTTFKNGEETFEVPVEEGHILTFPACFLHCSKPNKADIKTVISFNY
jgi:uncharacterized protein YjlB